MSEAIEALRQKAFELPPREQHRLAWFIAENIGYVLVEEPPHPDSPHHPKAWTPAQFWEFVEGFVGEFDRNQMREMLAERDLRIVGTQVDCGKCREVVMKPRIVGHTELCLFLLPYLQQGDFTVEALVSAILADFQIIDRDTLRKPDGIEQA